MYPEGDDFVHHTMVEELIPAYRQRMEALLPPLALASGQLIFKSCDTAARGSIWKAELWGYCLAMEATMPSISARIDESGFD